MKKQKRERKSGERPKKEELMGFRIESELKEKYIQFCENNGMAYGKRIRLLMENDLKNNKLF
jgi:antitoxin component of RelBE/YafQ-DinJ toxin-antitoxin module